MGLDCYLLASPTKPKPKEEGYDEQFDVEIAYARENWYLHEIMQKLYYNEKFGDDPDFNCVSVYLNREDIPDLLEYLLDEELNTEDEQYKEIITFVKQAKTYLEQGMFVYYYSWF